MKLSQAYHKISQETATTMSSWLFKVISWSYVIRFSWQTWQIQLEESASTGTMIASTGQDHQKRLQKNGNPKPSAIRRNPKRGFTENLRS